MTIELKDVVFSYPETPDKSVLNILSWAVSSHQRVFVHGPSGGGKSTLLNVLSGIIRPVVGELMMLSQRLDQMTNRQLDRFRANHIGYIFQQFNLIPYLNAVDNIRLANQFSKTIPQAELYANIIDLLTTFGLDETDRDRPTEKLSIGQQQRIAIARALINKPELLLLDEPTASLDPETAGWVRKLLQDYQEEEGATILLASHDMKEVEQLCQKVILLRKGELVEKGSPSELLTKYDRQTMEDVFLDVSKGPSQ